MQDIKEFLTQHNIAFENFDHPAVFTCEEAMRLKSHVPGTNIKNIFMRDKKGKKHFLVVVGYEKSIDTKELSALLDEKKLGFASPERLEKYLGLTPGSVTLLGLINDPEHHVQVVIDEEIWNATELQCHPLINTATLVIPHEGIESFLKATGHEPKIVTVPETK